MKSYRSYLLLLMLSCSAAKAQELNCNVQVISQQIQTVERRIFDALQTSIFEFMNNNRWTKDNFKTEERINCNLMLNITKVVSSGEYQATLQIQARRPVFQSSYNSPILNFNDENIQFKYLESENLLYNEQVFTSNLIQILAFYAYIIIGYDYDTFALNGGTPYFQKAQQLVAQAQATPEPGWRPFENNRNRYWMAENMLDPKFGGLRECMYNYHRLGLDMMVKDKDGGRMVITESLMTLRKVFNERPNSLSMKMFFDAKAAEIADLYSQGTSEEKSKIMTLVSDLDPTNSNKYQKISQGIQR